MVRHWRTQKHATTGWSLSLMREINAGLATPNLKAHLTGLGDTPLIGSPAAFGQSSSKKPKNWAG